jgi:hypothetical protein
MNFLRGSWKLLILGQGEFWAQRAKQAEFKALWIRDKTTE